MKKTKKQERETQEILREIEENEVYEPQYEPEYNRDYLGELGMSEWDFF